MDTYQAQKNPDYSKGSTSLHRGTGIPRATTAYVSIITIRETTKSEQSRGEQRRDRARHYQLVMRTPLNLNLAGKNDLYNNNNNILCIACNY